MQCYLLYGWISVHAWLVCALQMSFSSAAHILNNRAIFPAFFRTIPSFEHLAQALVACMEKFNWTQLAIITQLESGFIGVSNLHTHSMSCYKSKVSKVNCEGVSFWSHIDLSLWSFLLGSFSLNLAILCVGEWVGRCAGCGPWSQLPYRACASSNGLGQPVGIN